MKPAPADETTAVLSMIADIQAALGKVIGIGRVFAFACTERQ